ncbi:CD225/dispanin family protein [Lysobacter sp. 5GHs7-4]|uniref:CD225/dispanin family protein n=1 Tax=Lysobacter sp. 5GHs7-4 TaxID=2904253 RepID=UPI001E534C08|nr:CD225/dispanin family protein [Lysobacter sp. 5GHs7-4]UHQ24014.1 CD225/dispanin family protein [Lysobacter sp. 5GHs7-4]
MNAPHGEYVPNHLVWAILSTLFCCLPLGVVSIVYAAQVDGKRAAGDIVGARAASRSAANWAIASAVIVPIGIALWLLLFGGLAVMGAALDAH